MLFKSDPISDSSQDADSLQNFSLLTNPKAFPLPSLPSLLPLFQIFRILQVICFEHSLHLTCFDITCIHWLTSSPIYFCVHRTASSLSFLQQGSFDTKLIPLSTSHGRKLHFFWHLLILCTEMITSNIVTSSATRLWYKTDPVSTLHGRRLYSFFDNFYRVVHKGDHLQLKQVWSRL